VTQQPDNDRLMRSSKRSTYTFTEQGTVKYADLQMAQAAALLVVAQALAAAIRAKGKNGSSEPDVSGQEKHEEQELPQAAQQGGQSSRLE
jgi:hypothetical protein